MTSAPDYHTRNERVATDPVSLALQALAWIAADAVRLERLLALTGVAPDELRARAAEPAILAATLAFLEAHEPDLLACADALEVAPATLVRCRETLEA